MKVLHTTTTNNLTLEVVEGGEFPEATGCMGGMNEPPSWDEYLGQFMEEYKPHVKLIRQAIEEMGWVGETADRVANETDFKFSDGAVISFSWRAWGDLMQSIVDKREGYMTYYCG